MAAETLDLAALRQWAEKRNIPYGTEMLLLFPRLCDDLLVAVERLDELESERAA